MSRLSPQSTALNWSGTDHADERRVVRLMRPRQALYWTGACEKHGRTSFGTFYRTMEQVDSGCLACWSEKGCLACPPAGAPFQADLAEDTPDPTSPEWNNAYATDESRNTQES